jgi:hypothetical protein
VQADERVEQEETGTESLDRGSEPPTLERVVQAQCGHVDEMQVEA